MRWAGMRRIANKHNSATIPRLDVDPFNRPDTELLIALQGSEILRNRPLEFGEAASEPVEASDERVLEAFRVNGSKSVCVALAHWDQSEEAPVTHEDHHVVDDRMKTRRYNASPHHLPRIPGRGGPDRERAHGRMDAVGSHDKVVVFGRAVTESDVD
jgi:hypothetical protein